MTDLVYSAQIIVGGLAMHGLMPVLTDWLSEWKAYLYSGEFNFDNDLSTSDWCEMRNPGNGVFGVVQIREYKKPWLPGTGRVLTQTRDAAGKYHLHSWLLDGWWKAKNDRRQLSREQQEAVNKGQWPEDGSEKN